jgi:hypothetical protein
MKACRLNRHLKPQKQPEWLLDKKQEYQQAQWKRQCLLHKKHLLLRSQVVTIPPQHLRLPVMPFRGRWQMVPARAVRLVALVMAALVMVARWQVVPARAVHMAALVMAALVIVARWQVVPARAVHMAALVMAARWQVVPARAVRLAALVMAARWQVLPEMVASMH